jgi:hypothetical protein
MEVSLFPLMYLYGSLLDIFMWFPLKYIVSISSFNSLLHSCCYQAAVTAAMRQQNIVSTLIEKNIASTFMGVLFMWRP